MTPISSTGWSDWLVLLWAVLLPFALVAAAIVAIVAHYRK